MARTAVILLNLGGPDRPEAVEPFLFNLFRDPAIIGLPNPLRWLVAKLISRRRAPVARQIYSRIGGGSPLVPETEAQAKALESELGPDHRVFIAMRYWHPFTEQAVTEAKAWGAERAVLLPLYPQFSTTTTASSFRRWKLMAARSGLEVPTFEVCCYPDEPGFIAATADLVAKAVVEARQAGRPRVLFSAHGLPQRVVDRGDPYPVQIEQSAVAVSQKLGLDDWVVCYQSRVGPLKWTGPAIEHELERAAADKVPVVVVPISFVSEHSETLVELDMDFRERADHMGIPAYIRVPAVGCHPEFIAGLARLVRSLEACRVSDSQPARTCCRAVQS